MHDRLEPFYHCQMAHKNKSCQYCYEIAADATDNKHIEYQYKFSMSCLFMHTIEIGMQIVCINIVSKIYVYWQ